jgi:hypothetical protein
MTDLYIEEYFFKDMSFGNIEIVGFVVKPMVSIAIFSFLTSLLSGIYRELDRS